MCIRVVHGPGLHQFLISNGDFETCWHYHVEQERRRNHTARYQQEYQLAA